MGFGSAPKYTPPPAVPPAAQPATLASSAVAASAASSQNARREDAVYGTAGGAEGVNPSSVNTAKTTLGGVN